MFAHYGVEPRARTMALQEPQVTVRVREVGTGEPVLLLHGITLGAVHWAPLIARMSSLRCIALDMPGHGGTSSVDFDGMDLRLWHVAMLRSCLDGLGLRSAHIVGHSYGGMFGLWLALDGPERVRSLITIGTPSIAFGARPDAMFKMLALPWVGRSILTMPSPQPVYKSLLARSLGRPALDAAPPELVRASYLGTRSPGLARTISSYLREQFRGQRAQPQLHVLRDSELVNIQRPVLVLWGDRDTRYQPTAEGRTKAALIPGSRFEVVTGGHEPWLDDPTSALRSSRDSWPVPRRRRTHPEPIVGRYC